MTNKNIKASTRLHKEIKQVEKLIREAERIEDICSETNFRELRTFLRSKELKVRK